MEEKEKTQPEFDTNAPKIFKHVETEIVPKFELNGYKLHKIQFIAEDGSTTCCHSDGSCGPC